MMLEAASIDLATVWISYFDKGKAKEMLAIPEEWEPHCMIYIGYHANDFTPNPKTSGKRHPLSHSVWYNTYEPRTEKL